MATHTSLVAPARTDAVAGQICQPGGPTLWIPDPDSGELRRTDQASRVWAEHPVSGALVRIRSWKDVRDLDRECRRAGTPWEHLVVVTEALATPAQVRASLAGEGPWPAVHTDEESARGQMRLQVFGPADPMVGLDPVEWVAELAADQKRLRQLGAGHVAHTLFGEKTRRDIVAGVGAAMLDRGPLGRLGNRHTVVALAAAAADLLSADEIADLLGWPAPDDQLSSHAAGHLRTVLGLLPAGRRLRFIEALTARSLGLTRGYGGYHQDWEDYYYDVAEHRGHGWDPERADPREPVDQYLQSVHHLILAAGAESLYMAQDGTVRSLNNGSLANQLELAAFAAEQYSSKVGALPAFTDDMDVYCRRLLDEVFPGIAWEWVWDDRLRRTLGTSVPGLPGSLILLPANRRTLSEWGAAMGNCIGDYGDVVDAGAVVGAVEVDGRVKVNFQLARDCRGHLEVAEVAARFNECDPSLELPVIDHLDSVVNHLPFGIARARRVLAGSPELPQHSARAAPTGAWTAVDQLEEEVDERFVPRCRRTAGGRRRHHRHDSRLAPLEALRRIASDPQMSLIAAEVIRSMEPEVQAAFRFGLSSDRSIAGVLGIAAAVSPADAWLVPGTGPLLGELLGEFDQLTPEELARRWDQIAPFGHSPSVDDAVRSALIALIDGSLAESLVTTLDRDGEMLARRVFRGNRGDVAEWRYPARARRAFDAAWQRTGLRPRAAHRPARR